MLHNFSPLLLVAFIHTPGAADLMLCGSECAVDAEKKYKKEEKDYDKDCKKSCGDEDDACEKACKDEEKQAKKDAEDAAEKEYKHCNDDCFKEESFLSSLIRKKEKDEVKECFTKCKKEVDKYEKMVECQTECVAEGVSNGRSRSSMGPNGEYNNCSFRSEFKLYRLFSSSPPLMV